MVTVKTARPVRTDNADGVLISAADVLRTLPDIGDDAMLNHLFIHVYLPHTRCPQRTHPHTYLAQFLPTFAGWRSGWLEIFRHGLVDGLSSALLVCAIHWHDGSTQECYVTEGGELILHLSPETGGRCATHIEHMAADAPVCCERSVVSVTHTLSAEEIASGSRGMVHGSISVHNNERKVSHVVGIDKDDLVACAKFENAAGPGGPSAASPPSDPLTAASFVRLPPGRIRKYAPELVREYQWRIQPRWQGAAARAVGAALGALFARAAANDKAVRAQMGALRARALGAPPLEGLREERRRQQRSAEALELLVRSLEAASSAAE